MARRSKYNPEKRRKLPEPRYHKQEDPFEELTKDVTAEKFVEKSEAPEAKEGKSFGMRRSKRPFEARKEEEEVEESLRQPEYGKAKRAKRRARKRN